MTATLALVSLYNHSINYSLLHTSKDINECLEGSDNCVQICINDIGSFHCNCSPGFNLSINGSICEGMGMITTPACMYEVNPFPSTDVYYTQFTRRLY